MTRRDKSHFSKAVDGGAIGFAFSPSDAHARTLSAVGSGDAMHLSVEKTQ